MNTEKSRYELFVEHAREDIRAHQDRLLADGTFSYVDQVTRLEKLQININGAMLVYLFGELLGEHLTTKFSCECGRNLLFFLRHLSDDYRFFILHELKNNKLLFSYS